MIGLEKWSRLRDRNLGSRVSVSREWTLVIHGLLSRDLSRSVDHHSSATTRKCPTAQADSQKQERPPMQYITTIDYKTFVANDNNLLYTLVIHMYICARCFRECFAVRVGRLLQPQWNKFYHPIGLLMCTNRVSMADTVLKSSLYFWNGLQLCCYFRWTVDLYS